LIFSRIRCLTILTCTQVIQLALSLELLHHSQPQLFKHLSHMLLRFLMFNPHMFNQPMLLKSHMYNQLPNLYNMSNPNQSNMSNLNKFRLPLEVNPEQNIENSKGKLSRWKQRLFKFKSQRLSM